MKWTGKISLVVAGLVLLGGIALAVLGTRPPPEPKFKGRLIDLLPTEKDLPGWTVEHLPIADTPEIKAKVDELLNFDQANYVAYTRADIRISIYAAYWKPGKMSVRSVAEHTPDVCWTNAGWVRLTRKEEYELHLPDRKVNRTEHRIFVRNGRKEHVLFWHVAGGELVIYGTGGKPPWYAAISEFVRWGSAIQQEQFFLRISSDRPLSDIWQQDLVHVVVGKVPGITGPSITPSHGS